MKQLPDGCVDAVITDPPYFLPAQHYCTRTQQVRNLADLGILEHFFRSFMQGTARVLKDDGVLYCFADGQSYPIFYAQGYSLFKSQRPLVWDKEICINGYGWRHQHELILFAEKPSAIPVPTGDGDVIRMRCVGIDDREHPAEKPAPLLLRLIQKHSAPLILDPFCGSGATCIAAKDAGRHFLGIELSSEYCRIARERIARVEAQPSLFEKKPEQIELVSLR
jgi:site-specific DNA-methyltransferase (adenine-specific)